MKDDKDIVTKIKKLIDSKSEGDYWDYKQEWYKDNERLLHDILCFANTVHDNDCYIIIGVSNDGEIVGINNENRMKQADVLDLLSNTVFAGDNIPEVRVDTIKIEGKEIDVITILNSYMVPYYLKTKCKRYNNIREGYIYTRIGDKNTPINQNATIQQIEMLWKKRLGLTKPPLTQIVNRLKNKSEWVESENTLYNIYRPEFKLVEEYNDDEYDKRKGEFYIYSQCNSQFSYETLKIMYNETILKEYQLVILDSGRYKTPVPEWGFIKRDEWGIKDKYTYKYYLKNSIVYKLQQFYFDIENEDNVYSKRRFDRVILYYENEEERLAFESYAESNQKIIDVYIGEANKEYFEIDTNNKLEIKSCKQRLSIGLALNKALREFRKHILSLN